MIYSVKFTAVLDTNVIYPLITRDLLFWFAWGGLYVPKWSEHIFDEWKDVMSRKGIPDNVAQNRVNRANEAFPDSMVVGYDQLIPVLNLPDPKDRHVLAAAIQCNADVIVTNNLKDFPDDYIESFSLQVKSPDDFLTDIVDLNSEKAIDLFREMVLNRRNPKMDVYMVLDNMRRVGLSNIADYLHMLL